MASNTHALLLAFTIALVSATTNKISHAHGIEIQHDIDLIHQHPSPPAAGTAEWVHNLKELEHKEAKPPVLVPLGGTDEYLEYSATEDYVDWGAMCSDENDGNLNTRVEVMGDIVELDRPTGARPYTIEYSCTNSKGLTATASKVVHVLTADAYADWKKTHEEHAAVNAFKNMRADVKLEKKIEKADAAVEKAVSEVKLLSSKLPASDKADGKIESLLESVESKLAPAEKKEQARLNQDEKAIGNGNHLRGSH